MPNVSVILALNTCINTPVPLLLHCLFPKLKVTSKFTSSPNKKVLILNAKDKPLWLWGHWAYSFIKKKYFSWIDEIMKCRTIFIAPNIDEFKMAKRNDHNWRRICLIDSIAHNAETLLLCFHYRLTATMMILQVKYKFFLIACATLGTEKTAAY